MSDYLDPANEELLKDFFEEAQQQVQILEQNIIVLENDPDNQDAIDEIFRAAHTLKGGAATVEMTELADFTHHIEDVLDAMRSNKLKAQQEVVDILLKAIDITRAMVEARAAGQVYEEDIQDLVESLTSFLAEDEDQPKKKAKPAPKPKAKKAAKTAAADSGEIQLSEYELLELSMAAGEGHPIYRIRVNFNEDNPMNTVGGVQVFATLNRLGKVLKTEPDFDRLYEDQFFPVVDYYLTTEKSAAQMDKLIRIPDVVLGLGIVRIDEEQRAGVEEAAPAEAPARSKRTAGESAAPEKLSAKGKEAGPRKKTAPAEAARPPGQEAVAETAIAETAVAETAAAEAAAGVAAAETTAVKKEEAERVVAQLPKKVAYGSVLRVDSRRIDDLLNVVSEAVIIKATMNQLTNQFTASLSELQAADTHFREQLKEFLDTLPEYVGKLKNGDSSSTLKRMVQERMDRLSAGFTTFEGTLKSNVQKFRNTSQNLNRITGELQEGVMRIRMVPISQIFARFPRLVRDLTRSLHKEVKLVTEGEDTELDKSVIEDILDPLIHCVRNSVDHGIESPAERLEAGKEQQGEIRLSAHNEGNMIVITVSDDGRGIDIQSIRSKAIERGVIHPSKSLTDVEAFNLIFEPGFSTASTVTNVSGRGVGLDVVRKQVEKLNGNVSVWSELGKGTRFTIKLPLTLAIIQGLLVRVGRQTYALPIVAVVESLRVKPSDIKMIDHYEVFNLREDVLSLLRLDRLFKVKTDQDKPYHFVVVVGAGEKRVGLMVDSLIGEEDVVIKPLRDQYTNSPGIAGATILGDGTVSLILDVSQLLEYGLRSEQDSRKRQETAIR